MRDEWLGAIKVSWNESGKIKHKFESKYEATARQIDDALAYSAVVCIASQLGVLSIYRSLVLCSQLIVFLEYNRRNIVPINPSLVSVEIELRRKEELYHLFHPKLKILAKEDSTESGVQQFLCNYLYHIEETVSREFKQRIRNLLVLVLYTYLKEALGKSVSASTDIKTNNWQVQQFTASFSLRFYVYWDTVDIARMDRKKYKEMLSEIKSAFNEITSELRLT